MKGNACLPVTLALMTLFLQVQCQPNSLQILVCSGTIEYPRKMSAGVNYLSPYLTYSSQYLPDNVLCRDFTQFKTDGIDIISLDLYWYRLEGNTRGSYDGSYPDGTNYGKGFLDEVKRVIRIANENGIKVLVTFHTLWGNDDSPWCTPDYVVDPVSGNNIGLAVVRSKDVKLDFVNMFTHAVKYLAGSEGIWAWAILNEPWYWGRTSNEHDFITNNGKTQKENFITLFQQLSNIVKIEDGRPVTIRFCNTNTRIGTDGLPHIENILVEDWGWDQRIFDTLDFIGLNVYLPQYSQLEDTWQNITSSNLVDCSKRNKHVWFTEFGSNLVDETAQASAYRKMLSFYGTLPVSGCLAWQWTSGNLPPGYVDPDSSSPYNICRDIKTGTGNLAYEELHSTV